MFGFQITLNKFDAQEEKTAKTRLFGRVLQVLGVAQLRQWHPHLLRSVTDGINEALRMGRPHDNGMSQ